MRMRRYGTWRHAQSPRAAPCKGQEKKALKGCSNSSCPVRTGHAPAMHVYVIHLPPNLCTHHGQHAIQSSLLPPSLIKQYSSFCVLQHEGSAALHLVVQLSCTKGSGYIGGYENSWLAPIGMLRMADVMLFIKSLMLVASWISSIESQYAFNSSFMNRWLNQEPITSSSVRRLESCIT